jgi:hypothetical protein
MDTQTDVGPKLRTEPPKKVDLGLIVQEDRDSKQRKSNILNYSLKKLSYAGFWTLVSFDKQLTR